MKHPRETLIATIRDAIHVTTLIEIDLIQEGSWLVKDIGIGSIDFLDISYELEKNLNRSVDFQKIILVAQTKRRDDARDLTVKELADYLSAGEH